MSTIEAKSEALQKSKAEEFATARPSRVIEMALEDLEIVEADQKYAINMMAWHEPIARPNFMFPDSYIGKCAVCLAGCVIANRFQRDRDDDLMPEDFNRSIEFRLLALDLFRTGAVDGGLRLMDIDPSEGCYALDVTAYEDNPTRFKADMRAMAAMLRNHGL